MSEYTISYDEVRAYVEGLQEGETAGYCEAESRCLIAVALLRKYPQFESVSVLPASSPAAFNMGGYERRGGRVGVESDDRNRLNDLALRFDSMGHAYEAITREKALSLFDEEGQS